MTKVNKLLELQETLLAIRNQAIAISFQNQIPDHDKETMMFEDQQYEAEQEVKVYDFK